MKTQLVKIFFLRQINQIKTEGWLAVKRKLKLLPMLLNTSIKKIPDLFLILFSYFYTILLRKLVEWDQKNIRQRLDNVREKKH
jgi:ABC-type arginine transport system permease subunit|tara:strand:- start:752 stop:1000 length:249 start_codon:yes stop_codon:yes gene_type:complete